MKKRNLLKVIAMVVGVAVFVAGCGNSATTGGAGEAQAGEQTPSGKTITLQVGFENSISEPIGQGLEKWKELLETEGDGSLKIELYPDSQLGDKSALIDSMTLGEGICTVADGAFYAGYGVEDFGIVFGPFLFDSWEDCWNLANSDWYAEQCALLEEKGLHIIASNWVYGERHTLTTDPVNVVDDLKGMKVRVPTNEIQTEGFNVLGASAIGMPLGEVYTALQQGTIDGAENPLSTLYGRKLQEVAKYLILDGHVKNFTTWVCSAEWYKSLTPEQQQLLTSTCEKAGEFNNEKQATADAEYLQKMKDEGVIVVEPTPEVLQQFKDKASKFYEKGAEFGWSEGLYDEVQKAMGK